MKKKQVLPKAAGSRIQTKAKSSHVSKKRTSLKWPITVQTPQGDISVYKIFRSIKGNDTVLRMVNLTETWVLEVCGNFDPALSQRRKELALSKSPLLKELMGNTNIATELDLTENPPAYISDLDQAPLIPVGDSSACPPRGPRLTIVEPGYWENAYLWAEYESKKLHDIRCPFDHARLRDGTEIMFYTFYRDAHAPDEAVFITSIQTLNKPTHAPGHKETMSKGKKKANPFPTPTLKETERVMASAILERYGITREQALRVVDAMVDLGATSKERAKPERLIRKEATIGSKISGQFSEGKKGESVKYSEFFKNHIINIKRTGKYYLKLS